MLEGSCRLLSIMPVSVGKNASVSLAAWRC